MTPPILTCIMHTFSKSVRDHALRPSCILKTLLYSVFKTHEDPRARSLTYTKRLIKFVASKCAQ